MVANTATKPVKGLNNLRKLSDVAKMVVDTGGREIDIPLNKIRFDPAQPRQAFHHLDGRVNPEDDAYIDELAKSIDKNGLIEPIVVQECPDGTYLVVIGECRTRAHLKLGRAAIRGKVFNDLESPAKRLLYQLAENVNRKDLSDDEMARSIRQLLDGANGDKPMAQVEVAEYFGKSEGWVSRFVKFGDEDLQRVWVKPGIADTVEKVYRLSILPKSAQVEILRRVDLPEGDRDRLEKPLNRNVIDAISREMKAAKHAPANKAGTMPPAQVGTSNGDAGRSGSESIQKALDDAAGGVSSPSGGNAYDSSLSTGGYEFTAQDRAKLLGTIPLPEDGAGKADRGAVVPPVNCRISVGNVNALLDILKSKQEIMASLGSVRCDLNIPAPLANLIANELRGVIVDDQEVPAILQAELSKLK